MREFDVIVVGAGFSGLYLLYRLRKLGFTARALEAAGDVGGTWWWNRYPGARCDVESMQYSYSFSEELQQEWRGASCSPPSRRSWTTRATSPTASISAETSSSTPRWRRRVSTRTPIAGGSRPRAARSSPPATASWRRAASRPPGCLISRGLESYQGPTYHTGYWPHQGVDFTGKHVGIVGTGSSAIQAIPVIAEEAGHVTVFQRTPNYSIPSRNGPMTEAYARFWKDGYAERRAEARRTRNGVLVHSSGSPDSIMAPMANGGQGAGGVFGFEAGTGATN